jgi:hypothetical protein
MSQRLGLEVCCVVRRFLSRVRYSDGINYPLASHWPLQVVYDSVLCCCEDSYASANQSWPAPAPMFVARETTR